MKFNLRNLFICLLVFMFCLTGCQKGGISQGTEGENSEQTETETPIDEEIIEEDTEDEASQSIAVEDTETGKKYTFAGSSPVYDRSLTEGKMAVYFMQSSGDYRYDQRTVVQGDATLIIAPDGTNMLIDTQNIASTPATVATLKALGIDTIDYLVISHQHEDHHGGYSILFRYIDVKHVYTNDYEYTSSYLYKGFMNELSEKNIPVTYLYEGDTLSLGEVNIEVLNPPKGFDHLESVHLNNGSLTFKMTYGKSTFLFSGDLFVDAEERLVEKYGNKLQADIHKLNHHGRDTSSSKLWIQTLQPKLVVAEGNDVYSQSVMGRCALNGAVTLSTYSNKTVVVWTTGDGKYDVQVEQDEWNEFANLPDKVKDGHFVIE